MNSDLYNAFALLVAVAVCWILFRALAQLVTTLIVLYFSVVQRWKRRKTVLPPPAAPPEPQHQPKQYHKDFDEPV